MRRMGWAVTAAAAVAVAIGGARVMGADDQDDERGRWKPCSEATVRGDYGIQMQGTRPAPGGLTESVIGVLFRNYDGQGSFSQVSNVKGSLTGTIPDSQSSGIYEVNPDCTGIIRFEPLPGILTTDRTGAPGYDPTNYTNTFGGTSSAAPLVSGVAALMLHANPNLTWRDVRRILALTARKNDAGDAGWATNGDGRPINHKYGYGTVDATAAVQMAVGFPSLGTVLPLTTTPTDATVVPIPDNNPTGITRTVMVAGSGRTRVDHVMVVADITHPRFRDLDITLTSPAGTVSRMAVPGVGGGGSPGVNQFATVLLIGEVVDGTWTLKIRDAAAGNAGTLNSLFLRIYAD